MKENKRFKRVQERKLVKLNSEITQLNTLVNQTMSVVKKERDRFKQIEQDLLLERFRNMQTMKATAGRGKRREVTAFEVEELIDIDDNYIK